MTSSPPASGSSRSRSELTPERLLELRQGPQGAAQVLPADAVAGRRDREHLRRRGALAGAAAPALARGLDEARARRAPGRGDRRRRSRRGSTTAGRASTTTATRAGERGSMQDEFLVHTREGEPCLRRERTPAASDPADRGRPALDLLLPGLPGAPAAAAAGEGRSGRRGRRGAGERAAAAAGRVSRSGTGRTRRAGRAAPS